MAFLTHPRDLAIFRTMWSSLQRGWRVVAPPAKSVSYFFICPFSLGQVTGNDDKDSHAEKPLLPDGLIDISSCPHESEYVVKESA